MYIGLHPRKKRTLLINKNGRIYLSQTSINTKILACDFLNLNETVLNTYLSEKVKNSFELLADDSEKTN